MYKSSQVKIRCIFVSWIFFFNLVYCELEVKITEGILKGQILKSRDERPFYSYTGIPYAKPPVGELRFKAPLPIEPWNGTLDATKEPKKCVQKDAVDSQEDCLYLNVYSPKTEKKLLPVMFWIHGGAFLAGYSGPNTYGPDYFMDKDVVLVTINYRLGILGFLSTEDDVIPGNYGMKDQVFALRWVRNNIVKFNGDPSKVTIFGESAGGASAGLHMLSPMSKGLFHKAVLQSGAAVCTWAISSPGMARKRAHSVATIAACNFDTSEDILHCLRKLPAEYFVELQSKFHVWLTHPIVVFNPVVESCDSSQDAFLCHHPIYDFKQESFVPAVVGLNSAEGGLFVASLYNETSLIHEDFQTNFNRLLSVVTLYNQHAKLEHIDDIGEQILKEYFPSGKLDDHTHSNAVNMLGDGCFTYCIIEMAKKFSSPVYTYFYDYQNEFSFNKIFGSCNKPLGVTHADELNSLFKINILNQNDLNPEDSEVSKLMVNIWTQFVTSKHPTIDGTDSGVTWPIFDSNQEFPFLHINSSEPKIIRNPFEKAYAFWSQLQPILHSRYEVKSQKTSDVKSEL